MGLRNAGIGVTRAMVVTGTIVVTGAILLGGWAQQGGDGFNQVAGRAPADPVVVARGKTLYGINCQACHGSDLRGGDIGGPNLLRSSVAMTDQHGENIVPIIQGGRQAQGMPKIGISVEDSDAVAAYVRSVIGTIGGQGMPPGPPKELNIVVGDATRGRAYFIAHCSSCHQPEGDLHGVATRFGSPRQLQSAWINGGPLRPASGASAAKPKATVTSLEGEKIAGTLDYVDDFAIVLVLEDGSRRSFRRTGAVPAVTIDDPAHAHRALLPLYTDGDIHDVTAYLVTLP